MFHYCLEMVSVTKEFMAEIMLGLFHIKTKNKNKLCFLLLSEFNAFQIMRSDVLVDCKKTKVQIKTNKHNNK